MTKKAAIEVLISLNAVLSAVKAIIAEDLVVRAVNIYQNDIYREMALMKQSTIILQVALIKPGTKCLEIVVFFV